MKQKAGITILSLITLFVCSPAFAAFTASTQWEVRTTGADTAGGGFDAGAFQ